ncbi:MAG: L,D-transpeptidase [Ilumatobacteraceae bacterium]
MGTLTRIAVAVGAAVLSVVAIGAPVAATAPGRLSAPLVVGAAAGAGAAGGAVPRPDPATCPMTPHGAVVDRAAQRAWLCDGGVVVRWMPITSATDQPDPGVYEIYAEDVATTSRYGPRPSVLDHFVAFTRGKYEGARIGFHAVPRYDDGTLAQPLETVGAPELAGASSGCIRLRPDDAAFLFAVLTVGDQVHVIS